MGKRRQQLGERGRHPSRTRGPTRAPTRARPRWPERKWLARLVRLIAFLLPLVLSFIVALLLSRWIPTPDPFVARLARWIAIAAVATVVLFVVQRLARKLLPLAALLSLTLVFPDETRSRFGLALRSMSARQLERTMEQVERDGLGDTPVEAAETLLTLVAALSEHDRMTRGHSERVRAYSLMIGEEMELDDDEMDRLRWAALLHDIGKLHVPGEVLNKPGGLTDEEYAIVKQHTLAGQEMVAPLAGWLGEAANAVHEHHERFTGGGYPTGVPARDLSLSSRIVCVADAFDVMTSARSYKEASTATAARAELERCAGTQFDPAVVRAMMNVSLGKLWRAMGPMSWVAQIGLFPRPLAQGGTAASAAIAALISLFLTGLVGASGWGERNERADELAVTSTTVASAAVPSDDGEGGSAAGGGAGAAGGAGGATGGGAAGGDGEGGAIDADTVTSVSASTTTQPTVATATTSVATTSPSSSSVPPVTVSVAAAAVTTTATTITATTRVATTFPTIVTIPPSTAVPVTTTAPATATTTTTTTTLPAAATSTTLPTTTTTTLPATTTTMPATTTIAPATTTTTTLPAATTTTTTLPAATTTTTTIPTIPGFALRSPGPGDQASQPLLTLAEGAAAQNAAVANLDTDRNADPGLTILRSPQNLNSDAPDEVQVWLFPETTATIDGPATLTLYLAPDGSPRGGQAQIIAGLFECTVDRATCEELVRDSPTASLIEGTFEPVTFDLTPPALPYTTAPGGRLELRVAVSNGSSSGVWVAYDSTVTPSSIVIESPAESGLMGPLSMVLVLAGGLSLVESRRGRRHSDWTFAKPTRR